MKVISFIISLVITLAVIIILNTAFQSIPPFGKFLSPQHGFWQNAEPTDADYNEQLSLPELKQQADVYFDDRMVPHIFAASTEDAYYMQGFIHGKFRLWQMEFQVFAASGRLTEILGAGPDSAYLNNDRKMRRMGMVFGAKKSLGEMESDTATNNQLTAYTAGVNAWITQLTPATLPLEYRLLNYVPEKWTNLKTALLLKYLSLDLTGTETDIEFTNAKSFFSSDDYLKMYPVMNDAADPIIPKGTVFPESSITPKIPATADSLYFGKKDTVPVFTTPPDKNNGSNNWVAGGSKTKSGRPILCNDPHLGLNLPSLWYEVHITTPEFSVYGASLPGSPAVVIGFNDSIAWGVTNAARDVLDFYSIRFNGNNKHEYWYNGAWAKADVQVENFLLKDGSNFRDTIVYTVFGPVMYDDNYNGKGRVSAGQNLAIRWKAHEPSNEFKTLYLLNKARNYDEYVDAIQYFKCPGQNFAFASKSGDIALWQQGEFPAKWPRQGDFIMPGVDGSYNWQGDIPQVENPHIKNPDRGFVSSANQIPADTTYPYYLNTDYDVFRGLIINRLLADMNNITPENMQALQNENYNAFAENALPFLLSKIKENELNDDEEKYFQIVKSWNMKNDPDESGPTIFINWIDSLALLVWKDELLQISAPTEVPSSITLFDLLKKDSALHFIDDISTPEKETIEDIITNAFKRGAITVAAADKEGRLPWSRFKDSGIRHLLRMEQLSRFHLKTGGGEHIINATKKFNGPSWKMVVHLTDETEAYGIYPGGQTGNPGSRSYDEFVDDWAQGKYYRLWLMKKNQANDRRVRARWEARGRE